MRLAADQLRAAHTDRARRLREAEEDVAMLRLLLHLAPWSGRLGIRGAPELTPLLPPRRTVAEVLVEVHTRRPVVPVQRRPPAADRADPRRRR